MRWGTRPGTRGGWGPSQSHAPAGNEGLWRAPTRSQPKRARLPGTSRPRGNPCAVFWSPRLHPVVSNSLAMLLGASVEPSSRSCSHSFGSVQRLGRLSRAWEKDKRGRRAPVTMTVRSVRVTDRQHAKGQAPRKSGMRSAEMPFVLVVLYRRGTRY